MSDEDIDLDRVVVDPDYRRQVIAFLNGDQNRHVSHRTAEQETGSAQSSATPSIREF